MIYGDGALKDPVAKIWELPFCVSPAYTDGLGTPANSLKHLADNEFAAPAKELDEAIKHAIARRISTKTDNKAEGTRQPSCDLLGSLPT